MRIAFVWDWKPNYEQTITWKDGLAAAIKLLSERHQVEVFTDTDSPIDHPFFEIKPISSMVPEWPDVILHWGDMTRPHALDHYKLGKPMAICFAGGEALGENVELFDHIFVESEVYLNKFKTAGYSASMAFGTNTDLFVPVESQAKVFDALFPATFAKWKRHELFAEATRGLSACAVGYMYPGTWEQDCYEVCEQAGNLVLPHVSAEALKRLYAASKCVVIPSRSSGGSQRTVLEAMAMNIPVIVTDSDKYDQIGLFRVEPQVPAIREMLEKLNNDDWPVNTRDYIVENWSHVTYADAIEKELLRLCQASQS